MYFLASNLIKITSKRKCIQISKSIACLEQCPSKDFSFFILLKEDSKNILVPWHWVFWILKTLVDFSCRETLIEYTQRIMMDVVFKATARSLKLEDNVFLKHFGEEALMQARFNFYPPCPRSDNVLGLKPHSDKSGLTMLLQDQEVEGLQLFKDGVWSRVPTIPHALVVGLGDQMEVRFSSLQFPNYLLEARQCTMIIEMNNFMPLNF